MKTAQNWYAPKSSNHQGTIASEGDGRTVAVAYDKADAPLLAAAPLLLEALRASLAEMQAFRAYWKSPKMGLQRGIPAAEEMARAAIAKATEEPKP